MSMFIHFFCLRPLGLTIKHSCSQKPRALLLVSTKNRDLWKPLAMSNTGSPRLTGSHSAHAQSQVRQQPRSQGLFPKALGTRLVRQLWLVLVSIYGVYKVIQSGNVVGPGQSQRSRFLVLTKRSAASGDENDYQAVSSCTLICPHARHVESQPRSQGLWE